MERSERIGRKVVFKVRTASPGASYCQKRINVIEVTTMDADPREGTR